MEGAKPRHCCCRVVLRLLPRGVCTPPHQSPLGTGELAVPGLKDGGIDPTPLGQALGSPPLCTGAHLVINLGRVPSTSEVRTLRLPTLGDALPSETPIQQEVFMPPVNDE